MKAIILAAGKGERLGNITKSIPKPMIEINGKPILQHNIELCKKYGINDIYINLHHLSSKIIDYIGDNINYSYENELLGTSGGVRKIMEDNNFNDNFFVIYGDNYHSNIDFKSLIDKSKKYNSIATILFHYRKDVENSGVAEFDNNSKILSFIEKPKSGETSSHWVNAGVYFLNNQILDYIPKDYSDFSMDIFPILLKNNISIYGICSNTIVKAFDTPDMLKNNLNLD